MSGRRLIVLLVVLGLVTVTFLSFFFGARKPKADPAGLLETPEPRAPSDEARLGETAETDERREQAFKDKGLLQGLVLSIDGRPIQEARVVLHGLRKEDANAMAGSDGLGVPERRTLESTTGAGGRFRFAEDLEDSPFGAVLLAYHVGHRAGGLDLLGDPGQWPTELVVTLEPAAPISVEVVDPSGKPQGGAVVHHSGKPGRPARDAALTIHERFFAQQALTKPDGRAELGPFPGEQTLWAEKGELISVPWQGVRPSALVLTLGESFTVGGTLALTGQAASSETAGLRILVSGLTGNLWRPLVCMRDAQPGDWGPLRVPLGRVSRYKARVDGAPVVLVEQSFERPRAGSHRRIDFAVETGVAVFLAVQDESAAPIPAAHAEAWSGQTLSPESSFEAAARPDGVIPLACVPPGWFRVRVSAPGYATQDLEAEAVDKITFPIMLQKGGSIAGRCVHEGALVTDFKIIYWKSGNLQFNRSESFFGREDGRFEVDGLATGDWAIHAASPSYPCGKPVIVSVNAESSTEVELELPTAIPGGGRIAAADTGEPIADALVQPYSSGGSGRSYPWGPGVPSAPDGTFELDAFVLGVNHVTIEAPGFALLEAEADATDEGFLDWGDIRLFRPQTLQVSLLGLENLQGADPSAFRACTEQGHILPEKRFDQDGIVRYEGVPPGDHRLMVYYPEDSWGRLQLRLDPGTEWNFTLKVSGDRRLAVHVLDSSGRVPANVAGVYWTAQEETGVFVARFDWTEDGHASFEGIQAARGQLWVLARDDSIVATKDVDFGTDSARTVEIRLGEEPFRVRVVNPDREPIPGAWVTIRSTSGEEIHGADDSGTDGWTELGGLPAGPLLMDVQHAVVGSSFGIPVDASTKELEYVFEAVGSLELELVDGDVPLAGALTRIQTKAGLTLGDARQTDDQGRVSYVSLGEGNYHFACHRADCWPTSVSEELAPGEQARVRVQMRRLADLEFTLLTTDGLPVSGAEVEIRSLEFDVPVATWIEAERVRAPGGLATDTRGTVRVEGLPRGAYAWALTAAGQELGGSFELEPAQTNRVSALLEPQR